MKQIKRLLTVTIMLAASCTQAESTAPVPAEFNQCTVCHGVQLKGNASTGAPRLSGMQEWYVENQLKSFRMGWRGNHSADYTAEEMRSVASGLSPELMKSAPKYVANTQSELTFTEMVGDMHNGEKLFTSCAACHGADGSGNKAMSAPSLLVQSDWYLKKQLIDFRDGFRGKNKDDQMGQLMAASASTLKNSTDISDLVAYITSLQKKESK